MAEIAVGQWRLKEAGEMQIVSGPLSHERVYSVTPDPQIHAISERTYDAKVDR